jgi:benzoyl-CoA reductase/2-hydroxyglutaryl-CoA dehydratase subunit BcrC/BadD/HgdB
VTPVIGWFCTYTPIELVHAAGFLPVRISGEPGPVEKAYTLAPPFICLYMRRALEKALEGRYDFLSGLVQGYTCDVSCGLANIWREHMTFRVQHTLPLPYNQNPESRAFYRASLLDLVRRLNEAGGRYHPEALDRSLDLYGRIRGRLLELYERRAADDWPLTASDYFMIVAAGFVMPPETYLRHLDDLAAGLPREPKGGEGNGFPVLVSGSLVEDNGLMNGLQDLGFRVAADDLCSGWRSFYPPYGEGPDPLERLIDRSFCRVPCPARSRARERFPLMLDLARRSGARGVLFLHQKFCTPHLADYPHLVKAFQEAGLPALLLEIKDAGMTGSLRTRLEAFLETHGGNYNP